MSLCQKHNPGAKKFTAGKRKCYPIPIKSNFIRYDSSSNMTTINFRKVGSPPLLPTKIFLVGLELSWMDQITDPSIQIKVNDLELTHAKIKTKEKNLTIYFKDYFNFSYISLPGPYADPMTINCNRYFNRQQHIIGEDAHETYVVMSSIVPVRLADKS